MAAKITEPPSPFAQLARISATTATAGHSLYNGKAIGAIIDDSVLDARPYSLTGEDTPKPSFYQVTGLAALQGPLKIPHLLPRGGPTFSSAISGLAIGMTKTEPALVPDANERRWRFFRAKPTLRDSRSRSSIRHRFAIHRQCADQPAGAGAAESLSAAERRGQFTL